jgi:hypothetical protein
MKLFQTSQHEIINISMIANIKPIHNREIGEEAERLYTKDEYKRIVDSKDVKKVRVMNQEVRWSQVDYPIVAYKVITSNGSVVISVPDYERLMKILSSWITDDAGEDGDDAKESEYCDDDDESTDPCVKLTQDVFKHPKCPKWANWAAIDSDGSVFVYATKPDRLDHVFGNGLAGYEHISYLPGWQKTLIKRED